MELFFRLLVEHNCGYRVNNDLFRFLELPQQGLEETGKIHSASTFSWLLAGYSENNAGGSYQSDTVWCATYPHTFLS